MRRQPGQIVAQQRAAGLAYGIAADACAIDHVAIIAPQTELDGGHGGDGARRADHLHRIVGDGGGDAVALVERAQLGRHVLHHRVVAANVEPPTAPVAGENFRQGDHAKRQRDRIDQPWIAIGALAFDPARFSRTAADIDQQHALIGRIEQRQAAGQRQPRFFQRRNDLQLQSGALGHVGHEVVAVGGAAAGLGGDMALLRHAPAVDLVGAHAQRLDGAGDGGVGQTAGMG